MKIIVTPLKIFPSKGPQHSSNGIWSSSLCMKKLGSSTVSQNTNTTLGNSVLVVCSNSTIRNGLIGIVNGIPKCFLCKNAIISMIVRDFNSMIMGIFFISCFGFQSLKVVNTCLEMGVPITRNVVYKDTHRINSGSGMFSIHPRN